MDRIKRLQVKRLQRRKVGLMERLRHNEFVEEEMIGKCDFKGYFEIHRETELLHYKIDVLNSRIHNIEHPDKKYYVLERSFPMSINH